MISSCEPLLFLTNAPKGIELKFLGATYSQPLNGFSSNFHDIFLVILRCVSTLIDLGLQT